MRLALGEQGLGLSLLLSGDFLGVVEVGVLGLFLCCERVVFVLCIRSNLIINLIDANCLFFVQLIGCFCCE